KEAEKEAKKQESSNIKTCKVEYHVWKKPSTTSDRINNRKEQKENRLPWNMKRNKRIFKLLDKDPMSVIKDKFLMEEQLNCEKHLKRFIGTDEKQESITKIKYKNNFTKNELTIIKYVVSKTDEIVDEFFPKFLEHKGKSKTETRYAIFHTIKVKKTEGEDESLHTYMALEGDGRSFIDFNKMNKTFAKKATLSKNGFTGFKKMKRSNILTKNKTHNIVAKPIPLRDYSYDKHYEMVDGFVATFRTTTNDYKKCIFNHSEKSELVNSLDGKMNLCQNCTVKKNKNITVNLGMEYTSFSNFEDTSHEINAQHESHMKKGIESKSIKTFEAINNFQKENRNEEIKTLNKLILEAINGHSKELGIIWPHWISNTPSRYELKLKKLNESKKRKDNIKKYAYTVKEQYDTISNRILDDLEIETFNDIKKYYIEAVFDNDENIKVPLFNCFSYSMDKINKKENSKNHILYNGDWYIVDENMYKYINDKYKDVFKNHEADYTLPNWGSKKYVDNSKLGSKRIDEDFYNINASMKSKMLCLDKKFIYLKDKSKIEFADLYDIKNNLLVAVKDGSSSAGVSHLVTQARATFNLLRRDYKLGQDNIKNIYDQYYANIDMPNNPKQDEGSVNPSKVDELKIQAEGKKDKLINSKEPIKRLILGIGSKETYDNTGAPKIPFLGRLAIVELFENYGVLYGFILEIKHIKIVDEQIEFKDLIKLKDEDDLYKKDPQAETHLHTKIQKYIKTLDEFSKKLLNSQIKESELDK
ncbi:MAG: TIGR04141 family sporadically distributed protein, partial [Mycoplasmataceae bacterium]|nr:TIGR04141 family sporadically distributed protein [Mycoplasmataceae bacterium]